jgi:hypothetical protein
MRNVLFKVTLITNYVVAARQDSSAAQSFEADVPQLPPPCSDASSNKADPSLEFAETNALRYHIVSVFCSAACCSPELASQT